MIGVLALQGAFQKHIEKLLQLKAQSIEVRTLIDLSKCTALVIPGGESTVISHLLHKNNLYDALLKYTKPIFGTCAGAILLSKKIKEASFSPLDLMDIEIERNAYGSQIDSFEEKIAFFGKMIPAVFIRAPQIKSLGEKATPLSFHNDKPILVQQGNLLAATFHPELTTSLDIHRYFLDKIVYPNALKFP